MSDRPEFSREARRLIAESSPLNPISLVGSWGLYEGAGCKMALVVGEPQPGIYLVERYDVVTDEPTHQELWSLKDLGGVDGDGGAWRFFDTAAEMRRAALAVFSR